MFAIVRRKKVYVLGALADRDNSAASGASYKPSGESRGFAPWQKKLKK